MAMNVFVASQMNAMRIATNRTMNVTASLQLQFPQVPTRTACLS
jgi:hypothetical protein